MTSFGYWADRVPCGQFLCCLCFEAFPTEQAWADADEQALLLRPDLRDDSIMFPPDGLDESGYTWEAGRMVGTPDGPPDWRDD